MSCIFVVVFLVRPLIMYSTNEDLMQAWAEFDLISSKGFACLPKPGKDAWQAFHQAGF